MLPWKPLGHGSEANGADNRRATAREAVVGGIAIVLVGGCLLWLALATPGFWSFSAILFLGIALIPWAGADRRATIIKLLAVLGTASAVDYFAWRALLINWDAWYVSVPLFIAEAFGAIHTLGLQFTVWPVSERPLDLREDPTRRPIFVLIPTVNEGPAVLEPTIRGALEARRRYLEAYPEGIVIIAVCNDGRVADVPHWRKTEALAERLGVWCVTRTVKGGAKAGNLEHAREVLGATGDALIVIFDADQIAEPDFLLKMIPPFADPEVGWVQTSQYYRNQDSPVARWANDQQQLFYRVLCPSKAAVNAVTICGTNVVIRASALDSIGGLPQDSITEDFQASIELHPRWRGVFVSGVLATGLGPEDLRSYFIQQNRWATGTLQVLRSHWRAIFLPWHRGLSAGQRLQYFLACTHYLSGIRDLVYVIVPLLFLFTDIPTIRGAYLETYLGHFVPFWLASQAAFWYVAWGKTSVRGIIIGFGSFPVLLGSAVTALSGRRIGFAVTAKERISRSEIRQTLLHLTVMVAYAIGVIVAITGHRRSDTLLVNLIWAAYNSLMLGGIIWLGSGVGTATPARLAAAVFAPLRMMGGWIRPRATRAAFVTVLVVSPVFAVAAFSTPTVPRFVLASDGAPPRVGVYLPVESIQTAQPSLERALGRSFQIVGRTQDINDTFDLIWARQLKASQAQPWITLLFREPGRPSYYSSLPSIANGSHDDQIRRWARQVRDYGSPVYLTILPQVDRDWVVSSAVANGGIPSDTPRAWERVQAIFRAEGAHNVAWVWAPADPANDAAYAPSAGSIDLVQRTLIGGYAPGPDQWPDAAPILADLSHRYPATPLLIEVYAAGRPEVKASWLREVGRAVAKTPRVYALVYHEASPDPKATSKENAAWSLASDSQSLLAMREVWAGSDAHFASRSLAAAVVSPTPSPVENVTALRAAVIGEARPSPTDADQTGADPPAPARTPSARLSTSDLDASRTLGDDGMPLPRRYVVQPGDTLSSIADRIYGDTGAWRDIAAANTGDLENPNQLAVGAELLLPARHP